MVGIGVFVCMVHGRWTEDCNCVPLWVIRARQVANRTVTRGVGQSLLVFSWSRRAMI